MKILWRLLVLKDSEKFCDDNGNKSEIETRGKRDCEGIYFNLKDVMIGFEMPNLQINMYDKTTKYVKNEHYTCFNNSNNKEKNYFMTLLGMIKIVNTSKCVTF